MKKTSAETLHTLNHSDATSTSSGTGSPKRKLKNPIAAAHSHEASVRSIVPWAAMGLARSPRAKHRTSAAAKPKLSSSLASKINHHKKRLGKDSVVVSSVSAAETVRKS